MSEKNSLRNISIIINELTELLDRLAHEPVSGLLELVLESPAVFMAGAGRSGLLLRCAAMRLMHLGIKVHLVGDTLAPPIRAGDLLLLASGSGETASLVAAAEKAANLKASVALVTANPSSSLSRLADVAVILGAPTPKAEVESPIVSLQPMGSLFEQGMFLFFEALVMELMRRGGITSQEMFKRHANLE